MDGTLEFCWLGNELCLDFHNTTTWTSDGSAPVDRLTDFGRLLEWCEVAGITPADGGDAYALGMTASQQAAALKQARTLRSALHGVFGAVATGASPSPASIDKLNEYLAAVVMRVDWPEGEGPAMTSDASGDLNPLLSPIVWSAASLLVSTYRDQIGRCSNPSCGWVYVDLSRRGNRRWCDMQTCGNRAKAKRHYARHRTDE